MASRDRSPYLLHPHRLADVLAAIQVFGSYRWDSRDMKDWRVQLGEAPQSGANWEAVLSAHPEFFGSTVRKEDSSTYYYLRLRRSYERTVDADTLQEMTPVEIKALKDQGQYDHARLARKALTAAQVEALMKTAVELQVRAAALEDRSLRWLPLGAAILSFVGAIAGSLLKVPELASPGKPMTSASPASPQSATQSAVPRQ